MKTVNRSRAVVGRSRRNARTLLMRGRLNSSTVTKPTDESRAIRASALSRTTAVSRARLSSERGTLGGVTVAVATSRSGARPHAVPIATSAAIADRRRTRRFTEPARSVMVGDERRYANLRRCDRSTPRDWILSDPGDSDVRLTIGARPRGTDDCHSGTDSPARMSKGSRLVAGQRGPVIVSSSRPNSPSPRRIR
jgi:hypothetical protein